MKPSPPDGLADLIAAVTGGYRELYAMVRGENPSLLNDESVSAIAAAEGFEAIPTLLDRLSLTSDGGSYGSSRDLAHAADIALEAAEVKRLVPVRREHLGQMVRRLWIEWAKQQPTPKDSWLVPWEGLAEPDKEVDRQIGQFIFNYGIGIACRADVSRRAREAISRAKQSESDKSRDELKTPSIRGEGEGK